MDGRALLSPVDLLGLPLPRLMSVLTALWMEWLEVDTDVRKFRNSFIRHLAAAAAGAKTADETSSEGTEDNPFPNVMRQGAVGVIGQS